jgi:hypothetical protein
MEADQLHRSANPNICASCEQLLEDDSPALMAEMGRMSPDDATDQLLDQPPRPSEETPRPAQAPASESKASEK